MKFCKTCGSELPDEAVFCTNCGATCDDTAAPSTNGAPDNTENTELGGTTVLEAGSGEDNSGGTTILGEEAEIPEIPSEPVVPEIKEAAPEPVKEEPANASSVQGEPVPTVKKTAVSDEKSEPTPKNKKPIIIISVVIALVLILAVIVTVIIKNNNSVDYSEFQTFATDIDTDFLDDTTSASENADNDSSESSQRTVKITHIKNNGMTSNDAEVSYDGFSGEWTDTDDTTYEEVVSGLCIYGTLEYDKEPDLSKYDGKGGNIYDKNYKEIEWDSLSEKGKTLSEDELIDSPYVFSICTAPKEKMFCVGLPDDITPGTYIVDVTQWFGDEVYTSIDITIEVE